MRNPKWAEMKAMNKRLRCTGDNKERRYFNEPSEVSCTMYMKREVARVPMYGRNPFRDGCVSRPSKRKVQNRFSKEEAGTQAPITMGIRTGAYSVCVCKSISKW